METNVLQERTKMDLSIPVIRVRNLCKTYRVPEREAGVRAALGSLFHRRSRCVEAIQGVSFDIAPGEIVAFLGPNGAGKTTTLKTLAGLLHPTAGEVRVLGHVPWRRDKAFLRRIALLMGQRNQLVWDIPARDSFELHRAIYDLPAQTYRRTLDELIELLDLGDLLRRPVRNLSLGERMRCELALALLHRPRVLFLDEPTIGLDVTMQRRLRDFVHAYNQRHGATVLLTSHYMADVVALCRRVIVIHRGRILFDGDLDVLSRRFSPYKKIVIQVQGTAPDLRAYGRVLARANGRATLQVTKNEAARVASRLLADLPLTDLTITDPSVEDVIEQVFAQEAV
jgi:ABC-2 type transport system ATP-binding protein